MIGYLHGKVLQVYADHFLLDVHGIGYRIFMVPSEHNKLHKGEDAELYIHTSVREDAIVLYGFFTQEEYDLFQLLISVSGIGPKVALGILSSITVGNLCQAIHKKQATVLTKLPGIGKKSAERLILELQDKVSLPASSNPMDEVEFEIETLDGDDMVMEAQAALLSLGYRQAEISSVLKKLGKCKSVQECIKMGLKELNRL